METFFASNRDYFYLFYCEDCNKCNTHIVTKITNG
jgi:hypothetical protein